MILNTIQTKKQMAQISQPDNNNNVIGILIFHRPDLLITDRLCEKMKAIPEN